RPQRIADYVLPYTCQQTEPYDPRRLQVSETRDESLYEAQTEKKEKCMMLILKKKNVIGIIKANDILFCWRLTMKIGIDAGGTLLKIVYIEDRERRFEKRPSSEIDSLIGELNRDHTEDGIFLTGGKAEYMDEKLEPPTRLSIEFDATYRGLSRLMEEQGVSLGRFVYLNVGTGTSFHQADGSGQKRVGGSGVGGGTLIGLSSLLTGVDSYEDIVRLAA